MAQAVVWQVPNLAQAVVDSTAGTLTYQTYDTTTAAWTTQWTMSLANGNVTLAQNAVVSGSLTANGMNPTSTVNSIAGTTAGTVYFVQPFAGSGYKKVLLWFDGYENDTATAQTIDYPTGFATAAGVMNNSSGLTLSTSTSTLTITAPDAATTYTGFVAVEGW